MSSCGLPGSLAQTPICAMPWRSLVLALFLEMAETTLSVMKINVVTGMHWTGLPDQNTDQTLSSHGHEFLVPELAGT